MILILRQVKSHLQYTDITYFSGMTEKSKLGQIISRSNKEESMEEKAEKFLKLIEEGL